jgi:hypothetical protein
MHDVSETLTTLFDKKSESDTDDLTIGEIVHMLHDLGFGMVLMLFALPVIIPALPPPIPSLIAFPLGMTGWQMLRGYNTLHLPEKIAARSIKRTSLQKVLRVSSRALRFAESYTHRRMRYINTPKGERLIGALVMLFSVMVFIPAPFMHSVPALAIAILGIAIIKKDGLAGIIGALIGLLWLAVVIFLSEEIYIHLAAWL